MTILKQNTMTLSFKAIYFE